ncbi:Fe(3+)-transporting ATPase [Solidesulfovibrio carbinoliphilus subsp. oakridgensis]|uniref:Fe(3+)-transporting ATPase n=1 Tax=Solidesulfovibrio carbinoliphilus subsp. oakridgensis TaxID=694327 RepID=G7QDY4_9BACT|nr:ABC transporter ATP-binding protein [Solidesulfovibrio carbinoliphilus]EHJ46640.1 Fe(3+)-transporting ATPase [Solidesulfovibrio carbinoliphilus subsp. oakridgensis]
MAEPLLTLSGVSYTYPGAARPVLTDVDFIFGPGERIGLFGPNGSGKTTLLHVMMGLVRPDAGEVRYKGRRVATEKEFREVRRGIGLLLQNADDQIIYPTVLDDVAFGPLNCGLPPREARAVAERTLDLLGLADFGERLAHRLSGGEKKLVSLAGVLAMEPEALFLDEPTNGLDPETRERIVAILGRLGKPLIVISHDWDFLAQVTGTYYSIEHGRLAHDPDFILHRHVHGHPLGDHHHHHHGG